MSSTPPLLPPPWEALSTCTLGHSASNILPSIPEAAHKPRCCPLSHHWTPPGTRRQACPKDLGNPLDNGLEGLQAWHF